MSVRGSAAVVFAICAFATNARADAASDAKDLFERARQLRSNNDCAAAAPLFEKAYALFPSALGPLRNAAECEESIGKWASARRSWLELKRQMITATDPKYSGWDIDAEAAAKRLAPRVSHLLIDVTILPPRNDAEALEVMVNGDVLANALVGTTLDRDPGSYVIRAHVGTGETAEAKIDLVTGEARTVRLVVAPPGQPLPQQNQNAIGTQTHVIATSSSPIVPLGWIAIALGGASFIGMGIALGVRQDALSSLTAQCPLYATNTCPGSVEPTVSRGNSASTAANILATTGSILAAAGIVMLVINAVSGSHEKRVALDVSPFGASFRVRFQ